MVRLPGIALLTSIMTALDPAMAQASAAISRQGPSTRDPTTHGHVTAKELPDGADTPAKADGNFILGPTHNPAAETTAQDGVQQGTTYTFTMSSADSKIYPGIAKALAAKGYHYQFVFARNAGHTDRPVNAQTLPEALEYAWQGYPVAGTGN